MALARIKLKKAIVLVKNTMVITHEEEKDPQREALNELYKVTGGLKSHPGGWKRKDNWGRAALPLKSWYGVTVDEEGRVTKLLLSSNHLRMEPDTELPMGLFPRLPHLVDLDLRGNRLRGRVPPDLAFCTQLQRLALFNNPNLKGPRNAPVDKSLGMAYRETHDFVADAPTVTEFFKYLVKRSAYRDFEAEAAAAAAIAAAEEKAAKEKEAAEKAAAEAAKQATDDLEAAGGKKPSSSMFGKLTGGKFSKKRQKVGPIEVADD